MAKQNKGRKFFAASATAALVASAIVPVASAAQLNDFNKISGYAKEAVQSLVDAGVIQGDANGNFNPLKTISRAEAATIFTNALELEAEGAVDFKDVKADAWYYDAIAATVENGIFEGVSATEFAPNKQLTRSEAAKILVDAFGLEGEGDLSEFADASTVKPWAKSYLEIAVANGVIKGSEANGKTNLNPNAPITRQDFAVVFSRTIENVDATPKVDKIEVVDAKTLNVTLSDGTKETVTLEKALEPNKETEVTFKIKDVEYKAKVTYVVTTATAVKSVSATNLKEVVVEFDGTVDKETAEDESNYALKSGKTIKSVSLSDDKKTATVTLTDKLTNNKADAISISNVKAGDKEINVKNVEFTTVDNKIPEVTGIKSLGTKAVKVTLSEPVENLSATNFTLDGKAYFGNVVMGAGNKSVILTPYTTSTLSVGDHKLTVSGAKDFAGFVSLNSTHEFKVVEDKDAPTITEATATLETVTLTFSEDVDMDTVKASNVYWKSGDSKKEASEFERIADNKYKFVFKGADKTLPTGKVDVYVEDVKDYSDNKIAKDTKVTVTPEIDQTRPEVRKVTSVDEKTIKVTFSKTVDKETAEKAGNYTVTDKDGKVVSVDKVTVDSKDSKSVIIDLYSKVSVGENTITIKNVKDSTKLNNTMLDYTGKFTRSDKEGPKFETVINADAKAKRVVLKFDKKMDAASLADSSNYLVRIDGTLQTLTDDVATLSVSNDATVVTITFAETIKGNDVQFATGKTSGKANIGELQVMGVKDTSGNVHDKFNGKDNIIDLTVGTTKLALAKIDKDYDAKYTAELVDRKTVKVKFSTVIKSASSNAFTSNTHKIDSIQVDGTSTVTVKFKDEIKTDGSDLNLVANLSKFVDVADNEGPVREETISHTTNLLDSVKPVLDGEPVVKDATITFTFSESLKAGGSADVLATDLTVTRVSDNKDLAISDYSVAVNDKKQVVITLSDKREAATAYKVTVKNAKYIIDSSVKKNAIADFSKTTADKVQTDSTIGENTAAQALKALNEGIEAGTATVAQYTAATITKVTDANLTDVNAAVKAGKTAAAKDLTVAEIQALVNKYLADEAAKAVLADLNTAKAAVEGATYTLETADSEETAATKVKAAVEALTAVSSKSFTAVVTKVSYTPATATTTDGEYKFTVKLTAADSQNVTTDTVTVVIPK
ncbi:S-layer homology domain-containing protein [Lysinibacillus fusiformis]|uniref:S-layer homology domain-containing protein n=1 Tax=Lysinibacillus fusiformis TaxID=28031 RepID=UPI003D015562